MLEKIKNKIEENKKNNNILNEYIKIFKNLDKAKELFKNNDDFNKINIKERDVD